MPLLIQDIIPRSLAAKKGIVAGDTLLTINGNNIRDFIDLQFYGSDAVLDCELQRSNGERYSVEIMRKDTTTLGIEPEPYQHRCCGNKCVFCFIDQMPPDLRNTLYSKDDDFLFSFVFGNYISLTNLSQEDFDRILKQRLSPLYISVHSTNPELRKNMMGYKKDFDILAKMQQLSKANIQLHCQIVLVPNWNDGKELVRTMDDLTQSGLNVASIGIVPVGLTRHRKHLSELRNLTPEEARKVIDLTNVYRERLVTDKIVCSDEIFIQSGYPIPDGSYYDDYPQIENGIGMINYMLDNWKANRRQFLKEVRRKNKSLKMVTSVIAQDYIRIIAAEITKKAECCPATVQPIINNFMGQTVTVSGLITFQDIKAQVVPEAEEIIALPGNIFNHDGITLDGFSQLDIKEYWQRDILIIDPLFEDWEWI